MNHGYSWLEVRSVDDEKRIIEGIATTPTVARDGDVLVTEGIKYALPIPFLYRHSEPFGNVIDAKVSKDGIRVRVQVAPAGTTEKIDEYWRLVARGIVRGLSIGWRTLEESFDKTIGGFRILKSEWLELSAVPVPADAGATITSVRSASEAILAASGKRNRQDSTTTPPGVSGQQKGIRMKSFKDQITSFEAKRKEHRARMSEIMTAVEADGRDMPNAEESAEYDPLAAEVRQFDAQIQRLRALEEDTKEVAIVAPERPGNGMPTRRTPVEVTKVELPKGTLFARAVLCVARGAITNSNPAEIARRMYRDHPEIEMYLRAAVEAGDTTTTGWAAELVPAAQQMQNQFLEILRPATIIGKINGFMNVPFNTRVPVQTGEGSVDWVGEGKAKPVTSLLFDTATITWAKVAAIVVITEELARLSTPAAEGIVRTSLVKTVAKFIDAQFVDPTITATANRPASITNGIAGTSPTGTTSAHFITDFNTLMASFIAANMDPSDLVVLMSATQAMSLSLMRNSLGGREFPDISMNGGVILGVPAIVSEAVGTKIIAVKAGDILLAEDPATRIDVSREASVEMSTTPISGDTSPSTDAVLKSLWQNNLVGIRVERYIKWQRARTSAVKWITGNAYVPS